MSLCITVDSEGFVAQHEHENGHLKSFELTFVIHNGVTKSKREIWVLVHSILLKWPLNLSLKISFFLCFPRLCCWTTVFWPRLFVDCSMTNVLGKTKLKRDKIPFCRKLRQGFCLGDETSSVLYTNDNMFPRVFWTYAPGPLHTLYNQSYYSTKVPCQVSSQSLCPISEIVSPLVLMSYCMQCQVESSSSSSSEMQTSYIK